MMKGEYRNKVIKYLIIIIDIFTITALAFQIHSFITMICYDMKNEIFLPDIRYIRYFFTSYDYYGFVGAITKGSGLIEIYEHYGWPQDIYYRIAEITMDTAIESLVRNLRFILFLANFWVIYKKKKDNIIRHPKTVIINIAFVVTKVILYYWYFYTAMGV